MDLREQVVRFRALLDENGLDAEDFELNVAGEAFRQLLAGGGGSLEIRCRPSGVAVDYRYDGTPSWLDSLARDLRSGRFGQAG